MSGILRHLQAVALLVILILTWMPVASLAESRVEVRKVLDTSSLGDPVVFDVGPDGAVLILTRDNLFDAGAKKVLFGEPLANPAWFAFAGEKLQLIACGALFVIDGGKPRQLLEAPLKRLIFAADSERTFISGVTSSGKPVLFIYKEGAGHKPLLELDVPIDAMALARGVLFFSAGPRIYSLREGGAVKLLAHLPGFSHIPSLTVDERNGLLYFSEGDHLYALRGNDFVVVRQGVGGMLRWRNDNLYILSWREHGLLRMKGLSEAMAAGGTLVPFEDQCRPPILSLYCEAEEKRAILRVVSMLESSPDFSDTTARKEIAAYAAEQKIALERIGIRLEKEAVAGAQGVLWGGSLEPKPVRAGDQVAAGIEGVGLTLWDGSSLRVGPDSKMTVNDCGPSRECRQTLAKGMLYFEPFTPPVSGLKVPASREYQIATEAVNLRFAQARLTLFASGNKTYVVVLEGWVKGMTPGGDAVIMAAGETLEVERGKQLGSPVPAEMERLKKWWEEIR